MRRPRRHRGLTEGEARLWGEIAKLITPLRGRPVPKAQVPTEAPAEAPTAMPAKASTRSRGKPVSPPLGRPPVPSAEPVPPAVEPPFAPGAALRAPAPARPKRPLKLTDLGTAAPRAAPVAARPVPRPAPAPSAPGLEWRERRNLQRGLLPIEARIDLHGLYQAEAHAALVGFLMRARAAGHARVLVVTGKGKAGIEDGFSERGVLRRQVPHWLRGAELRTVVLGFEEAARNHGGQGALYVRLRRR